MPEFRTIVKVPPLRLNKDSIEALAKLAVQGVPTRPKSCDFTLSVGDAQYGADSLEELWAQALPVQVESLSISVRGWTDDNRIDRGIWLTLRPTGGEYQVHSSDEVWFRGKLQQLSQFMQAHTPWYRPMVPAFSGISGAGIAFLLIAATTAIKHGSFLSASLSIIALGALTSAFSAHLRGTFLPHCRLRLSAPKRSVSNEVWMLIFTAISALAALAGVMVPLFSSKGTP
ncbi:MAG: hypothetical protein NTZ11_10875 [Gammaproteobacteria bacterium]|nr:hypothetical protein [Gammaproteobacteria bacterium]